MYSTAPKIELILHPGTTPEELTFVTDAIHHWSALANYMSIFHELRIIVEGGAYLTAKDTAAFWHAVIPPDAVEDIIVDGKSLSEIENNINPDCDGEVDVPAADTYVRS